MRKNTFRENTFAVIGEMGRRSVLGRANAVTLLLSVSVLVGTAAVQAAGFEPDLAYPAEVALNKEPGGYLFRRFPGAQRLYISDADKNGESACNFGCDTTYVPVYTPADAKPMGEWTIVNRTDGRGQWAYHGQPVYTFFHDAPDQPAGEGKGWHLLPYET